jgi:ABC-type multidrug transport system fused ATPase/permease subunit
MSANELPNPRELEEIRGKAFTSRVAMVTAIYAVLLAISSLGGNRAMKETLLAQQQASDQWAYYQAKSIREHLYKSQAALLEDELGMFSETVRPQSAEKVRASIKAREDQAERYSNEKKEIEQEAGKLEKERDTARAKDFFFEFGGVLLEIAIVTASVAIIALSRMLFAFSLVMASLGALMTINGYMQIFALPFLH